MKTAILLCVLLGDWPTHEERRAQARSEGLALVVFVGCVPDSGPWISDHEPESILPHARVYTWYGEYAGYVFHSGAIEEKLRAHDHE
jgi:hypothetical protein